MRIRDTILKMKKVRYPDSGSNQSDPIRPDPQEDRMPFYNKKNRSQKNNNTGKHLKINLLNNSDLVWLLFKVRREEEEEQRHASCQLIGSCCPAGQPASLSTWTFQVFNIEHQRLIRNITRQIWITLRQTQTAFFFFIFQLTWNKDLWAITFLCKGSVPMCQNLLIWTGNL